MNRHRSIYLFATALSVLLASSSACQARVVEEVLDVPVTATDRYGKTVSQTIKVTVFRDDERPASPFLVLNHGRSAHAIDFPKMGRVRFTDHSKYFVGRGFAVFVPTRIGYGVSGGEDVEYSGTCSGKQYPPVYEAAAQQVLKVIAVARSLPYVDPARGIVVGQSFGGTTSIAIAAKGEPSVVATINFAGGGGGDPVGRPGDPCRPEQLEKLFASYGPGAKIPTLWLYSPNDRYMGERHPKAWFAAFVANGGHGEFVQLPALEPPLGEDGHLSFSRNPAAWRPPVERFLEQNGFKAAAPATAPRAGQSSD